MMTVVVPIFRRTEARIVLLTDIWKSLLNDSSVRIVLIVPQFQADEYRKELGGERVIVEPAPAPLPQRPLLDALFYRLSLFYADTPLSRYEREQHILLEQKKRFRYTFSLLLLTFFGNARALCRALRFLDLVLVRDRSYDHLFDAYRPDVVFIAGTTHGAEHALLREAKRRGVRTAVLISSPEELAASRLPFRIVPDFLLVENEKYGEEAACLFDISHERILVVGNPLFDRYRAAPNTSRKEFCARYGIDPSHAILLFASVGGGNPFEWQILKDLDDAIQKGALPNNITILVRHYPEKNMYIGNTEYSSQVVFDNSNTLFAKDKTYLDVLADEMASFTDMFAHAAVVVTTAGKLVQTAVAFEKPIVNLAYDGWEEKPLHQSVRRFYTDHYPAYRHMKESGAVVLARSKEELFEHIIKALENTGLGKKTQEKSLKRPTLSFGGNAGKCIAKHILKYGAAPRSIK